MSLERKILIAVGKFKDAYDSDSMEDEVMTREHLLDLYREYESGKQCRRCAGELGQPHRNCILR